jgi:decaprenyl-phosphate phosphoribosyltransferase
MDDPLSSTDSPVPDSPLGEGEVARQSLALAFVRLARPKQWSKSIFVLIGPLYGLMDHAMPLSQALAPALWAALGFALLASACYAINDVVDAPKDRLHPRKRRRPVASGRISPAAAYAFSGAMALAGCVALLLTGSARWIVLGLGLLYAVNVMAYSFSLKRRVIADVMSLSFGFVLRVLAGCAAASVSPSTWLLNCTLFLAMFLAFGKRLGERRTVGAAAVSVRGVQAIYTDELLRMMTLVTGVVTLLTYAGYVQSRDGTFSVAVFGTVAGDGLSHQAPGLNVLWFTLLPVTYALLRAIVLLERGRYDDPTEMATRDWPLQISVVAFGAITVLAFMLTHG